MLPLLPSLTRIFVSIFATCVAPQDLWEEFIHSSFHVLYFTFFSLMKTMIKNYLRKEEVSFILQLTVSLKETKVKTQDRSLRQELKMLFTCLFLMACSAIFLIQCLPRGGIAHGGLGSPTLIIKLENVHTDMATGQSYGSVFSVELLSSQTLAHVKLKEQNKTKNITKNKQNLVNS